MARGKYKRKRERRLQEETERMQKAAQACKLSQQMNDISDGIYEWAIPKDFDDLYGTAGI